MMATVPHFTSGLGLRKFQANGFLLTRVYVTKKKFRKRQTSIPTAGFEPAIPASKWQQTHPLDRAATGIGS